MSDSWGYTSYRGKNRKKRWLVIGLLLCLLASLTLLFFQRFVVYREDGSMYVAWPWQRESEQEEDLPEQPPEVNLVKDPALQEDTEEQQTPEQKGGDNVSDPDEAQTPVPAQKPQRSSQELPSVPEQETKTPETAPEPPLQEETPAPEQPEQPEQPGSGSVYIPPDPRAEDLEEEP